MKALLFALLFRARSQISPLDSIKTNRSPCASSVFWKAHLYHRYLLPIRKANSLQIGIALIKCTAFSSLRLVNHVIARRRLDTLAFAIFFRTNAQITPLLAIQPQWSTLASRVVWNVHAHHCRGIVRRWCCRRWCWLWCRRHWSCRLWCCRRWCCRRQCWFWCWWLSERAAALDIASCAIVGCTSCCRSPTTTAIA